MLLHRKIHGVEYWNILTHTFHGHLTVIRLIKVNFDVPVCGIYINSVLSDKWCNFILFFCVPMGPK